MNIYQKKSEAQHFTIPGGTEGFLYQDITENTSVAMVTMDGVYPEKGWSINSICTESILLIEGSMKVIIEDTEYDLVPGDIVSVPPNHKYRVVGKGTSVDIINPKWDKKQNKIIED